MPKRPGRYTARSHLTVRPLPLRLGRGALLLLLSLPILPVGLVGQSRVVGVVIDGETGSPIVEAYVLLEGAGRRTSAGTNADGGFTLSGMEAGTFSLSVRHLAYRELRQEIEVAGEGRVTRVRIELFRRTVAVDPIYVEADRRPTMGPLASVYDRVDHMRLLGQGRFFEREQFDEMSGIRVSEMVGTLPGVEVNRGQIRLDPTCRGTPLYYLDGVPLRLANETIDDWVQSHNVEVMEVYRRVSEIPGEFGGSAAQCGVIAIWTRRSP